MSDNEVKIGKVIALGRDGEELVVGPPLTEDQRVIPIEMIMGVEGPWLYTWDSWWGAREPNEGVSAKIYEGARKVGLTACGVPAPFLALLDRAAALEPSCYYTRQELAKLASLAHVNELAVVLDECAVQPSVIMHIAAVAERVGEDKIFAARLDEPGGKIRTALVLRGERWAAAIVPLAVDGRGMDGTPLN